ncbi:nuclease-related domain-containing protein [Porticoccus sp.]
MMTFPSFVFSFSGIVLVFAALFLSVYWQRKKNKFSPFTEKLLRSPGYTLGKQFDDLMSEVLVGYLLVALSPIFYLLSFKSLRGVTHLVILVVVLLAMAYGIKKLVFIFAEANKLRLGLDGEVYTGQELNFLMRKGAWVYHDIPYQYGNIDHVVVSTGGVFVVETKAVRKPAGEDGKRQSRARSINGKIQFPHLTTDGPVKQARLHAGYVKNFLHRNTGKNYPVTAVVALPGWYVTAEKQNDWLLINPKRGGGLTSFVERNIIPASEVEIIANHIESFARTVQSGVDRHDPDAHKKYDFWLNRRHEDNKL